MNKMRNEDPAPYGDPYPDDDNAIIAKALQILDARLRKPGQAMDSPKTVKDYLRLQLAEREHEVFCVLWLDAQNRMIAFDEMFRGTINQTSVYPREVVKQALKHNAAGAIFSHNHQSGVAEPSRADEMLTKELKTALALIDVRVLDHIIVGLTETLSFAERGLV